MTQLDGERYLRLVAEQMLLERPDARFLPADARLVAAGAALVAVGALTPDAARAIADAYARTVQRRDPSPPPPRDPAPQAAADAGGAAPDLGRWRAVPSGRVFARPWGRLVIAYVLLTNEATVLSVTVDAASPDDGSPGRCSPWRQELPSTLEIGDDQGTMSTARFEGSRRHGEQAWHGGFRARPPLAPDAAWISVLGERVDLTSEPPAIQSWAEQVEAGDPARDHLWERVATRNDFHDPRAALEAAIGALAAVGALSADDPVIGDARLAAELVDSGSRPKRSLAAQDTLTLPVPWRSLLTRWSRTDGPTGSVLVGKVSAPFDGVRVAVTAIESRPEFFRIGVEVVPGLPTGLPYRALDDLRHITWWAVDDQGNYSLAEQGSWSPGAARAQGSLGFWPGLDPRAAWVDLMPTTASARAVIRVPLPWATT
jgi:plasmid stabilization system protein ParE